MRNPADTGTIDAVYKDEDKTSPRLSQAFALVMEGQAQISEFSPLQYLINTLNSAAYAGEAFALLVEAARLPEIRALLYQPLQSGTRDEKIYLARVMAASGDDAALPYLQHMSQDPDSQVAAEGLKALRRTPPAPGIIGLMLSCVTGFSAMLTRFLANRHTVEIACRADPPEQRGTPSSRSSAEGSTACDGQWSLLAVADQGSAPQFKQACPGENLCGIGLKPVRCFFQPRCSWPAT